MTEKVKVTGLVKRFDDLEVLNGIDLTVKEGEVVCLIGPSGSGKSTLIDIVLGLLPPQSGRMYIDDTLVRQTGINIEAGADMFLFKDSSRGETVKGILYSFRGYQNGELVQDYVPAKRKADGKVGVYDIVNNEFITSPNGVDFVEP